MTWIDLEGAVNVRDLGGLPTVDGGSTVPGRLLRSENLDRFRENAARLENQAVFEIPEMLERILEAHEHTPGEDQHAAGRSHPSPVSF